MERIIFNNTLSPTERIVLACIYTMQPRIKHLTLNQIASITNVSKVTISRTLKSLKRAGILNIINNVNELGGTLPNTYEVYLDKIERTD